MSEENINIATKEYTDAHFGNTSETNDNLVIATKEYVDSIPTGMVIDGTALKGRLCNHYLATTVGAGADGSSLTDGSYMFAYRRWVDIVYYGTSEPYERYLHVLQLLHPDFVDC